MADSMAAFLLAMSCLNEDEWEIAAPAMGMASSDRETLQCVMRELEGPAGVAAALQPADGGPPLAFFAAAVGCGMSTDVMVSMVDADTPATAAPAAAGIAPLNLNDPSAFMSQLSPAEQSCIPAGVDPQQLGQILSPSGSLSPEADSLFQCLEDETLLRIFITGLIGLTEPLSVESSACIRVGAEGIDLRSLISPGGEAGEQNAMFVSMSAFMLTLSCLNDEEYQAASATTGMDPGEKEDLQCVMEQLGGPEGMAEAMQAEDESGFIAILTAAFTCGVQLEMGTAPGG